MFTNNRYSNRAASRQFRHLSYPRRSAAKQSLETLQKTYDLCPKLLGLEKSKTSCFSYQLHKCRGACINQEPPELYNQRVSVAFEKLRIDAWPYEGAVLIKDVTSPVHSGIVIDQWCVVAEYQQDEACDPVVRMSTKHFDLDAYKIVRSYLAQKKRQLQITPVSLRELQTFC